MIFKRGLLFVRRGGILPILLCCFAAVGCRTGPLAEFYSMNPFYRQGPEETEYGPSPAERREQILAAARDARKLPPAERMRTAQDLALKMQNEIDPIVRADIVRALGHFNSQASQDALRMAMQDRESDVRIAACDAWKTMGGPEAVAALSEMIASDTDNDVRLAATRALGAFDDPAVIDGLSVALNDDSPAIQYRAMESLKRSTGLDLGHDVVAWQQYIENGSAPPSSREGPALVERLFDRF